MDKSEARALVWSELCKVAKPDSRFHLDFNEYIPDFEGNELATTRLFGLDAYQQSDVLFITPDNCLERLRAQAVRDGKAQIMPTYGIRRGFVGLRPKRVPRGLEDYAALLDVIETLGIHISLAELQARHKIGLTVTGASALNLSGASAEPLVAPIQPQTTRPLHTLRLTRTRSRQVPLGRPRALPPRSVQSREGHSSI